MQAMTEYADFDGVRLRTPCLIAVPGFGWKGIEAPAPVMKMFVHMNGLRVIIGDERINKIWWRHVSVSRSDKIPSYEDLKKVKDQFIGEHRPAYQIMPKTADHINMHPYCLHLWTTLEAGDNPMPDFRKKGPDGNWYI